MSRDARTRAYVRAQRATGRDHPEIVRLLKRAIAREVVESLTRGLVALDLADLRPARQAKNITLTAALHAGSRAQDPLPRHYEVRVAGPLAVNNAAARTSSPQP